VFLERAGVVVARAEDAHIGDCHPRLQPAFWYFP